LSRDQPKRFNQPAGAEQYPELVERHELLPNVSALYPIKGPHVDAGRPAIVPSYWHAPTLTLFICLPSVGGSRRPQHIYTVR
jgi:hypothetical protein